jgi:hypothetical protein
MLSEKEKKGFIINNQKIKKISGPISFYYLKPTQSIIDIMFVPIIILFGDEHLSKKGMCNPCNQEKNCHIIGDHNFLKLLDTLAIPEENQNVDFYIERFFNTPNIKFKEESELQRMVFNDDMIYCYHHKVKECSECPAKKIRWQLADIRHAGSYFDRDKDGNYITKYQSEIFEKEVDGKKYIEYISDKYKGNKYIEFTVSKLIKSLFEFLIEFYPLELIFNNSDSDDDYFSSALFEDRRDNFKKNSEEFLQKKIYKYITDGYFKTLDSFQTLLNTLIEDLPANVDNDNNLNIQKFVDELFCIMTIDNSLIMKQINKQDDYFKDINLWKKIMIDSIKYQIKFTLLSYGMTAGITAQKFVDNFKLLIINLPKLDYEKIKFAIY